MSSAFEDCLSTEARGEKVLEPFMKNECYNNEFIKVRTSRFDFDGSNPGSHLQLKGADYVGTVDYSTKEQPGQFETQFFDFKIEKTNPYDNFLVETISNIELDRPGWFVPEKMTDYICNYHLDTDNLIIWNFRQAVHWFYEKADWSKYKKTDQKVYSQRNKSECFLIPIKEMLHPENGVYFRYCKPKSRGFITSNYEELLKEYDFKHGGK